jgi:hypothetical protein
LSFGSSSRISLRRQSFSVSRPRLRPPVSIARVGKMLSLGEQNCTGNKSAPSHNRSWILGPNMSLLAEEMAKDNKPPDVRSRCLPCPLTTQGEPL